MIQDNFEERSLVIRLTRSWLKMPQKEFAKKMRTHPVQISSIETGRVYCTDEIWNRFVTAYEINFLALNAWIDMFLISKEKPKRFVIEESEKYPGCYNIYNKSGSRVHYFAENDDRNYERAVKWVNKFLKKNNGKTK